MPNIIIADTSCLIILNKIGELELLQKVYGQITTTSDITKEFGEPLPYWVKVNNVKDIGRQQLLEIMIDKGESSAIALAMETDDSILILDDHKARKVAGQLDLKYTGTIGILIKAKQNGTIKSIRTYIQKIKQTNFHISKELETAALRESGE